GRRARRSGRGIHRRERGRSPASPIHDRRAARGARKGHVPGLGSGAPPHRGRPHPRPPGRPAAAAHRPARGQPPRCRLCGRAVIRPAELIERKRDGGELSADEIRELVLGYTRDDVPEYQMAAFLMAVYFRGLSGAETFALTDTMVASGETIDLGAALRRTS